VFQDKNRGVLELYIKSGSYTYISSNDRYISISIFHTMM